MRAITVQQPYAWAILRGGKDVENRHDRRGQDAAKRSFNQLGPRLIHSSQRYAGPEAYRLVKNLAGELGEPGGPRSDTAWAFGALLGAVETTGVHVADECYDPESGMFCSPWAEPNAAHLVLADPRVFHREIPYKGQLGSWSVTDDAVLAQIRRQLR